MVYICGVPINIKLVGSYLVLFCLVGLMTACTRNISSDFDFVQANRLNNITTHQQKLLNEHVYGGIPDSSGRPVLIRNGYVISYNSITKTPDWVAYHIVKDYRNIPKRKGKFAKFNNDPDVLNEPSTNDYKGLFKNGGYARGHLAPYGVMGGDRDGDGIYAVYGDNNSDPDDELTVFQANYMTNIAPQHHRGFNGSPGLWWKLERWIQDDLVEKQGKEVWVFAGCIFGPGQHKKVTAKNVWVPPMFYKIVIIKNPGSDIPYVLAFLFPHQSVVHGEIQYFLVSVDIIEALSGNDFFKDLEDDIEDDLEKIDTWELWNKQFKNN